MQLLTLLILVVPFRGAVEATPHNFQRQTTTCGLKAADFGAKIIQTVPDVSLAHCTTSCAKNSACLAYAFGYGYCRLYSASVAVVAKSNPASQAVLYDKACRMPICGLNGNDKGASILQTTPAGTLSQCASSCAGNSKCGSYRFASGSCRMYSASVSEVAKAGTSAPSIFYDKACPSPTPTTSTTTSRISTTNARATTSTTRASTTSSQPSRTTTSASRFSTFSSTLSTTARSSSTTISASRLSTSTSSASLATTGAATLYTSSSTRTLTSTTLISAASTASVRVESSTSGSSTSLAASASTAAGSSTTSSSSSTLDTSTSSTPASTSAGQSTSISTSASAPPMDGSTSSSAATTASTTSSLAVQSTEATTSPSTTTSDTTSSTTSSTLASTPSPAGMCVFQSFACVPGSSIVSETCCRYLECVYVDEDVETPGYYCENPPPEPTYPDPEPEEDEPEEDEPREAYYPDLPEPDDE